MRLHKGRLITAIFCLLGFIACYGQNPLPAVRFQISADANYRSRIDSNRLGAVFTYKQNNIPAKPRYKAIIVLADTIQTDSVILKIGTNASHDNIMSQTYPISSVKGQVHRTANVLRIPLRRLTITGSFTAVAIIKDHRGNLSAPKYFYK